jgi:gamma-glutamyl:cysteine ligase YbdK (ATP-grasp superfamily)
MPSLDELRMHQNSVWPWLRPVYDPIDGGHLRIELRALPAGPGNADMFANAAFYVGLAEGLVPYLDDLLPGMPFSYAKYNFYRAAQHGLDAKLVWPDFGRHRLRELSQDLLLSQLLPIAEAGLQSIGLAATEISHYLGNIAERLATRQSGASWQLATLDHLQADGMPIAEACRIMFERYIEYSSRDLPIARWKLP